MERESPRQRLGEATSIGGQSSRMAVEPGVGGGFVLQWTCVQECICSCPRYENMYGGERVQLHSFLSSTGARE